MKTATGEPEAGTSRTSWPATAAVVSQTRHGCSEFRRSFEPRQSSASTLRSVLGRYLAAHRIDDTTARQIVLCADEAFINAVDHAAGSPIGVSADIGGDELCLEVADGGRGFDPDRVDHEAVPDLLGEHGRGLFLIRRLMDDLTIVSGERGTTLRMRLALGDGASRFARRAEEVA
jgi:serine/threonine-protein kinase RsbW